MESEPGEGCTLAWPSMPTQAPRPEELARTGTLLKLPLPFLDKPAALFLLVDGLRGNTAAATLCAKGFHAQILPRLSARSAELEDHELLALVAEGVEAIDHSLLESSARYAGCGLAVALLLGRRVVVGTLGDCRAFLSRPGSAPQLRGQGGGQRGPWECRQLARCKAGSEAAEAERRRLSAARGPLDFPERRRLEAASAGAEALAGVPDAEREILRVSGAANPFAALGLTVADLQARGVDRSTGTGEGRGAPLRIPCRTSPCAGWGGRSGGRGARRSSPQTRPVVPPRAPRPRRSKSLWCPQTPAARPGRRPWSAGSRASRRRCPRAPDSARPASPTRGSAPRPRRSGKSGRTRGSGGRAGATLGGARLLSSRASSDSWGPPLRSRRCSAWTGTPRSCSRSSARSWTRSAAYPRPSARRRCSASSPGAARPPRRPSERGALPHLGAPSGPRRPWRSATPQQGFGLAGWALALARALHPFPDPRTPCITGGHHSALPGAHLCTGSGEPGELCHGLQDPRRNGAAIAM